MAMPLASAVPARQGVLPAGGELAGLQPVVERLALWVGRRPRRRTSLPLVLGLLAALAQLPGVRDNLVATSKVLSGSKPSTFLVAATSVGAERRAVRLAGALRFGAGQAMMVRSWMKLGRSVTALAASARRRGPRRSPCSGCRRWSSRPSGRASRTPRSGPPCPRLRAMLVSSSMEMWLLS